jgi:hypothetical protein
MSDHCGLQPKMNRQTKACKEGAEGNKEATGLLLGIEREYQAGSQSVQLLRTNRPWDVTSQQSKSGRRAHQLSQVVLAAAARHVLQKMREWPKGGPHVLAVVPKAVPRCRLEPLAVLPLAPRNVGPDMPGPNSHVGTGQRWVKPSSIVCQHGSVLLPAWTSLENAKACGHGRLVCCKLGR